MTQAFSFGFSGKDIRIEEDEEASLTAPIPGSQPSHDDTSLPPSLAPSLHTLQELLSTLPSKISYNTFDITTKAGRHVRIPRRELFDIRLQVMAEDRADCQTLLDGLETGDIAPNVYEGGFKTWECSVDLVKTLLDGDILVDEDRDFQIVELGCGTAIPTMALFQQALMKPNQRIRITLADYNYDVLRLVTVPNLLLSWAHQRSVATDWRPDDDLEITPVLIDDFMSDLQQRNIAVEAIAGAWGKQFVDLTSWNESTGKVLVLASETIYSPASLNAFTKVVLELIRGQKSREGFALVAAKRMYFGVGGGVDEFCRLVTESGGETKELPSTAEDCGGVSRVLLEVRCSALVGR